MATTISSRPMAIEMGTTLENALTWPATYAAARTNRICSVAYAVEDSASDAKIASAVFLVSRSCVKRSVLIGLPTSKRFNEAIFWLRPQGPNQLGRAKRCHSVQLSKSADCGEAHLLVALLLHFGLTSQHSFFRAVYYATSFESQCHR